MEGLGWIVLRSGSNSGWSLRAQGLACWLWGGDFTNTKATRIRGLGFRAQGTAWQLNTTSLGPKAYEGQT